MQVFHPTQTPKESFLGSLGRGFQAGVGSYMKEAMKNEPQRRMADLFAKKFGGGKGKGSELAGKGEGDPFSNMSPEQEALMAESMPKAYKALKANQEKQEQAAGIEQSLDWLEKNVSLSGRFGVHPKWGGIEAQGTSGGLGLKDPETGKQLTDIEIKGKREEIDTTGIWLADRVYTHFNKGVLNEAKWEDVKNRFAPRSDLPAEVNRARIAALRHIMGLPKNAPTAAVDKVINREQKALDKIGESKGVSSSKKGKTLNNETIDMFLKEANDDPDVAAEMARAEGYTW